MRDDATPIAPIETLISFVFYVRNRKQQTLFWLINYLFM